MVGRKTKHGRQGALHPAVALKHWRCDELQMHWENADYLRHKTVYFFVPSRLVYGGIHARNCASIRYFLSVLCRWRLYWSWNACSSWITSIRDEPGAALNVQADFSLFLLHQRICVWNNWTYFLCSYEDVFNGKKYVLFDGRYSYTQAATKCTDNGGILAMAADADTFNFLINLHNVYSSSGALVTGMFLDGSTRILNPRSSDWYCASVQGSCPSTMPWQFGKPPNGSQAKCVGALSKWTSGVVAFSCQIRYTAMCKLPL